MTTTCSYCGKQLNETSNETFLVCNHCNRFTPKGAQSFKDNISKGGNNMEHQIDLNGKIVEKKEKKITKKEQIKKLILLGLSIEEIKEQTGFRLIYIKNVKEEKQF